MSFCCTRKNEGRGTDEKGSKTTKRQNETQAKPLTGKWGKRNANDSKKKVALQQDRYLGKTGARGRHENMSRNVDRSGREGTLT